MLACCVTLSWDRLWSVRRGHDAYVRSVARPDNLSEAEAHLHYHTQIQVIFQDISALQLLDN